MGAGEWIAVIGVAMTVITMIGGLFVYSQREHEKLVDGIAKKFERVIPSMEEKYSELTRRINEESASNERRHVAIETWNAKQELKIETTWNYVMDNSKLAVVQNPRNLGTMQSPLKITEDAKMILEKAGLLTRIKQWCVDYGSKIHNRIEFEQEITRVFRQDMIDSICNPNGWHDGECIAIAISIADEALCESERGVHGN